MVATCKRLGFFAPKASGAAPRLQIDLEQMQNWRERGAQPTERVLRLVREHNWGEEKVASLRAKKPRAKNAHGRSAKLRRRLLRLNSRDTAVELSRLRLFRYLCKKFIFAPSVVAKVSFNLSEPW